MTLNQFKAIIFFSCFILSLTSCFKEPKFNFVPEISFNSISKDIRIDPFTGSKKDSIIISIKYKDGDGDLGWNANDVGINVDTVDYNYLVTPYRKKNGEFTKINTFITLSGFYPKLLLNDKPAPIEGILNYRLEVPSAYWPVKKDTVKFQIQIKDRAGNKSNEIETAYVVLNQF